MMHDVSHHNIESIILSGGNFVFDAAYRSQKPTPYFKTKKWKQQICRIITKINIARIELSKENYSNALEVLQSFNSSAEHPIVYEVKGDALAGLEKNKLAIDQYSLALENSQNESQKSLLKMKINKINN
jgi:predicted negative regulator of RcsB-dependent stress response